MLEPTGQTGPLPLTRPSLCPFYQEPPPGSFPGLGYDPTFICSSDPEELVEPSEAYKDRYCVTEAHRDCARFRTALAISRAGGGDPFYGPAVPFVQILATPLVPLIVAGIGVIAFLLAPLVAPVPLVGETSGPPALIEPFEPPTLVPTPSLPPPGQVRQGRTTAGVNLRAAPSTTAESLRTIGENATVEILAEQQAADRTWYQIRFEGLTGWVAGEFIQVTTPTPAASPPPTGLTPIATAPAPATTPAP